MDCSPPGSSVHGILQVRILEWIAIPFSKVSSQPRNQIWVSWITDRFFTIKATREAEFSYRSMFIYFSLSLIPSNRIRISGVLYLHLKLDRYVSSYKNRWILKYRKLHSHVTYSLYVYFKLILLFKDICPVWCLYIVLLIHVHTEISTDYLSTNRHHCIKMYLKYCSNWRKYYNRYLTTLRTVKSMIVIHIFLFFDMYWTLLLVENIQFIFQEPWHSSPLLEMVSTQKLTFYKATIKQCQIVYCPNKYVAFEQTDSLTKRPESLIQYWLCFSQWEPVRGKSASIRKQCLFTLNDL